MENNEEKIPTKTRIKEWIFVIGVIVVVTVASIIAYNYGLNKNRDTKEETNVKEEEKNQYKLITLNEYNNLENKDGYYSISNLEIKIESNTSVLGEESNTITFSNSQSIKLPNTNIEGLEKLDDYILIKTSDSFMPHEEIVAYSKEGKEVSILNETGIDIHTAIIIGETPTDANKLGISYTAYKKNTTYPVSANVNENDELVNKYCKNNTNNTLLTLYLNVIKENGKLKYNVFDYECREPEY